MKAFIDKHPVVVVFAIVVLVLMGLNAIASRFVAPPPTNAFTTPPVLAAIYGKDKVEDYKTVFDEQSFGQTYYPFVEYVERAREGKFVNVTRLGTRCHYANKDDCVPKGGPKEIWVFGGSTTFGYSIKDNETIPAYLSKSFPDYHVINFGAASYYSTIERIRFENLLTQFPPPRAAIFIDGLNDFFHFDTPDKTMVSDMYSAVFSRDRPNGKSTFLASYLEKVALFRLFREKFGHVPVVKPAVATHEQILAAIRRLNINHSITEGIGDKLGIVILNVIQPVPSYGVGHQYSKVPKELLNLADHVNSKAAYELMLDPAAASPYTRSRSLNLAGLGINDAMYVDTVHYTPQFNEKIASEIYKRISGKLK